jgi:hypothetical protein
MSVEEVNPVAMSFKKALIAPEIPDRGDDLAARPGAGHPVLCLSLTDSQGDSYRQRDRKRQRPAAQDTQNAGAFSE